MTKSTQSTGNVDEALDEIQLGVYRLILEKKKPQSLEFNAKTLNRVWIKWVEHYSVIRRLILELVPLAPNWFFIWALSYVWHAVHLALLTALENRVLQIERAVSTKELDARALMTTFLSKLAFVSLNAVLVVYFGNVKASLQKRVNRHYEEILLAENLHMDLPTVQKNMTPYYNPGASFSLLEKLLSVLQEMISGLSHIILILFLSRSSSGNHGILSIAICLLRIVLSSGNDAYLSIYQIPRIVEVINKHYMRRLSLLKLQNAKYRLDIIGGNIIQYILKEYKAATVALGDTSTEYPEFQYSDLQSNRKAHYSMVFDGILSEIPRMAYVTAAFLNPSNISLSTLSTVQGAAGTVQYAYSRAQYQLQSIERDVTDVQQLLDIESRPKALQDGHVSFPAEKSSKKGMSFELKNVSFQYPGGGTNALDDVSFKIGAGELVVVVGANGSGKSTFVNILSRYYDPTSGEVLVDGVDLKDYHLSGIREATATLTQDHNLYPLSLKENIGLGWVDHVNNEKMISEAVSKGGARKVVSKLKDGLDTFLDPPGEQYAMHVDETSDSPLSVKLKELKKKSSVSGGERQRLVAARTFMRFQSNKVRFVAIDEPTSALDPEGELELFTQLRKEREGKTMLFITHRFGPLTKYADRIICMKDGKIVESGHHMELMKLQGEYFKMYSIQAKAFEPDQEATGDFEGPERV